MRNGNYRILQFVIDDKVKGKGYPGRRCNLRQWSGQILVKLFRAAVDAAHVRLIAYVLRGQGT